jgi:hypothetical protein
VGQKVLSRPLADSFSVGRRQKTGILCYYLLMYLPYNMHDICKQKERNSGQQNLNRPVNQTDPNRLCLHQTKPVQQFLSYQKILIISRIILISVLLFCTQCQTIFAKVDNNISFQKMF